MRRCSSFFAAMAVLLALPLAAERTIQLTGANEVEINSVLVSVNGFPVTLGDVIFETWEAESRVYALGGSEVRESVADIRMQKLEELIDRRLLVQEFDRRGYELPAEYVEMALEMIARDLGCRTRKELAERAASLHTDMNELRIMAEERIKVEMLMNGLVLRRVNVTPRQISAYIDEHRDEFLEYDKIIFSMLKLDSSREDFAGTVEAVAASLHEDPSPENFTRLALEYSDWKRSAGGDSGELEIRRLRPEFIAVLGEEIVPGVISEAVEIPGEGVYYLFVREIKEAAEPDWSEIRKRVALRLEEETRIRIIDEYLKELRSAAVIERQQI